MVIHNFQYEMLTGHVPFEGKNVRPTLNMNINKFIQRADTMNQILKYPFKFPFCQMKKYLAKNTLIIYGHSFENHSHNLKFLVTFSC